MLYKYEGPQGKDPGAKFDNVKAVENKIIYGVSQLSKNAAVTK